MRLTLRTLLAYLDDLLEPSQAKELGVKIQESEMAAELIMKIRDVVRKRRLTAPLVSGPGCDLDANVVAEYLDNTLSPEGVTQLEQICLESETHLAEVAASHQILTLVLGEPVDISSHSRERMYALGMSAAKSHTGEKQPVHVATAAEKGHPVPMPFAPLSHSRTTTPEQEHGRQGDSFIGRMTSGVPHPSAVPPSRSPLPVVPAGANGQNTSSSAIHKSAGPVSGGWNASGQSHGGAAPGLAPAVKPVSTSRPPSTTIPVVAVPESPSPARHPQNPVAIEPFDRTIPDYLRRPPMWKRALPLAILVLIAVWVGMLVKDKNLLSGILGDRTDKTAGTQVAAVEPNVGKSAQKVVDATESADSVDESSNANLAAAEIVKPTKNPSRTKPEGIEVATLDPDVDAPPPLDEGDVPVSDPDMKQEIVPVPEVGPDSELDPAETVKTETVKTGKAADLEAIPDAIAVAPLTGKEISAVDIAPPNKSTVAEATPRKPLTSLPATPRGENRPKPARYVSTDGVVLRFDDDREGKWFPLPHREFVFAEDILAIPEPFDAQIQLGTEKHRLNAVGPTLLQVVDTRDDLSLAINVERGRIILQPAEASAGGMPSRMKVSLTVQNLTWLIELPDATSRCGIEIIPREPHQFEEDFGAQGWSGRMYIASGSVKVTTPEGMATIFKAPDTYVLAPETWATVQTSPPSSVLPNWMGERKQSTVAKKIAQQFETALSQDDVAASEALLELIDDRMPEKSRLATACLGLIGDYQMMLTVLDRNEHHESREAAIAALRSWVNLNPTNRDKLKAEVGVKFFKEDSTKIYRMIWGYQEQDLRGKQISRQLVDFLDHESLAMRELAAYHIRTLTNRRLDFDARGPQSQRNAAIQQLNKILDRDESLLPALPKGAGTSNKKN